LFAGLTSGYSLEQIREVLAYREAGKAKGKVVVKIL
jgi:hypothetical protein